VSVNVSVYMCVFVCLAPKTVLLSLSEPNHEWYEFAVCANYKYARSTHPLFAAHTQAYHTHSSAHSLTYSLTLTHAWKNQAVSQREEARHET